MTIVKSGRWYIVGAAILATVILAGVVAQKAFADPECNIHCSQDCTGVDVSCKCGTLSCADGQLYYKYTTGTVMKTVSGGTHRSIYQADLFCYYVSTCDEGAGSWFANCSSLDGGCDSVSLYLYCTSCIPHAGNVPVNHPHFECEECDG